MGTQLSGAVQVVAQVLYKSNSEQLHNFGELVHTNDGRAFRYCKAGELLVSGSLYQSKVENTSDQNLTAPVAAIGATSVTPSTTVTVAANEYAQGYLVVTVTPGLGKVYLISSHPAASAATVTLNLADPIEVALTTTSRLDLVANGYRDVLLNPSSATANPIGAAVAPIASGEFGWLGVGGAQPVLADGALAVGVNLIASNGTNGAVEDVASTTQAIVGTAMSGIATGNVGMALLFLH